MQLLCNSSHIKESPHKMNKLLISKTPIFQLIPQFSPQFQSLPRKNQNFLNTPPRKCSYTPKITTLCIGTPSNSLSYGGWDDPQLNDDSFNHGESTQFQSFLNSLGINDKKYIFVYLLGFICALGVTRIKVSSIIAIPACVIVFGIGFSLGYVNGGHLSFNGIKKKPKDEIFRGSYEKLRSLVGMLNGVDAKIVDLKIGIKNNIESDRVTLADLDGFVEIAESVNVSILDAKSVVEGLLGSVMIENGDVEKNVNQKSSKRRKQVENGFGMSRYFAGLFKENLAGPNPSKTKDNYKKEDRDVKANDGKVRNIFAPAVDEQILNSLLNRDGDSRKGSLLWDESTMIGDKAENLIIEGRRMNVGDENGYASMGEMDGVSERAFGSNDYRIRNKRFLYINNEEVSLKMNGLNGVETWDSRDGLIDSMDFSVSLKQTETEASVRQEKNVRDLKGTYSCFDNVEGKTETEDDPSLGDQHSANDNSYSSSLSSKASEDKEFNRYLTEANILLKEAKRVLLQQGNNGNVEDILYKSAILLSKAIEIRPMSLLAVGQLGNTHLLHGELKLRISRELRAILAGKDSVSIDKWELNEQDDKLAKKNKLRYALVNVCEECEELLIKAGRNYRLALSIDGNDMRALYNWGLALSFRGQLIADIGPGAAQDAEKVFLAAIDKFDAMLTKSNIYAPDALFRWGAALQQRSRLRRRNSKEKVKLLQQARRLYEDALDMDSDNVQVQEAISSCISELNYWYN